MFYVEKGMKCGWSGSLYVRVLALPCRLAHTCTTQGTQHSVIAHAVHHLRGVGLDVNGEPLNKALAGVPLDAHVHGHRWLAHHERCLLVGWAFALRSRTPLNDGNAQGHHRSSGLAGQSPRGTWRGETWKRGS